MGKFTRFIMVGLTNTISCYFLFIFFTQLLSFNLFAANFLSYLVVIPVSYLLYRIFVFQSTQNNNNKNMSLILGSNHVTREEVALSGTPEGKGRHVPIPHIMLIEETVKALVSAGFNIEEEDHVLARQDKENPSVWLRYFGGFALTRKDLAGEERRVVLGLRNSNDKGFAAAI